jgi:hypothetical protein
LLADTITRYQFTTGSMGVRQSGCNVYMRNVTGSGLIWTHPVYGLWDSQYWSSELTSSYELIWSGCYF